MYYVFLFLGRLMYINRTYDSLLCAPISSKLSWYRCFINISSFLLWLYSLARNHGPLEIHLLSLYYGYLVLYVLSAIILGYKIQLSTIQEGSLSDHYDSNLFQGNVVFLYFYHPLLID